jgi:predicted RNA-binding protein (TIGR00451 family)
VIEMENRLQEEKNSSNDGMDQAGIKKVVVSKAALPFVARGGHVFSGQILSADPEIHPGDEILVVDDRDRAIVRGFSETSSLESISVDVDLGNLKKVVVSDSAAISIARGGHVLAHQVVDADQSISRGDWVTVVDRKDRPLITAYAAVSGKEIIKKEKGAVEVAA